MISRLRWRNPRSPCSIPYLQDCHYTLHWRWCDRLFCWWGSYYRRFSPLIKTAHTTRKVGRIDHNNNSSMVGNNNSSCAAYFVEGRLLGCERFFKCATVRDLVSSGSGGFGLSQTVCFKWTCTNYCKAAVSESNKMLPKRRCRTLLAYYHVIQNDRWETHAAKA